MTPADVRHQDELRSCSGTFNLKIVDFGGLLFATPGRQGEIVAAGARW